MYVAAHELTGALPADEAALLRRLAALAEDRFVTPDLLVYRQMDPAQLAARVEGRGRPGEDVLDLAHLRAVHEAFERFATSWGRCPVIAVTPGADVLDPKQGQALAVRHPTVWGATLFREQAAAALLAFLGARRARDGPPLGEGGQPGVYRAA